MALNMRFAPYKSGVDVFRRPTQVQLMRGDFLETALYWAGVIALRFLVTAEKESQIRKSAFLCLGFSVSLRASPFVVFYTAVVAFNKICPHILWRVRH